MKWVYVLSFTVLIIMTGCQVNLGSSNKATATSTPLSTTSKAAAADSIQFIGTYSNQSEQVSLYNSTDGVLVKSSSDKGKTWSDAVSLPFKQDWEKQIQAGNVYTSLLSSSSPSWILLTSDPAAGLMSKSLYESSDNGKTWIFINDVSQVINGYITGISFRSPTDGWISASYHYDTAMLPLYRTKDGGKTWLLQNISIPKGYKYGNAYPPVFDENNSLSGTLKIEFVSDASKDVFEFTTKDGGETWVKKENDVLKVTLYCAKSCKVNIKNPPFEQKVITDVNQVNTYMSAINKAEPIKGLPFNYGAEFLMYVSFKDGTEKIYSINISDKQNEAASLVEPMNNEQGYQGYSIPKKSAEELRAIIYYRV